MNNVYLFDANGVCTSHIVSADDDTIVAELCSRSGADSYVRSELSIPLSHARLVGGELVSVEPTVSDAVKWDRVRERRNLLLYASDWATLTDAPLSAEQRLDWLSYRQLLRDITQQASPDDVQWPIKPS